MRVFWPKNIERRTGTAVGWRIPRPAGAQASLVDVLVVVDVVGDDSPLPIEGLARVLPHSEPASSDGFTIWADTMPIGYSDPAETVLFTPGPEFVIPSAEGKLAEYGAAVLSTDIRGLLMRLNAVASAQDELRGVAPSSMIGRFALLVPWIQVAALLVNKHIFTRMGLAVVGGTMASTMFLLDIVLRPPRQSAFRLVMEGIAHFPLQAHSALIHQLARRAGTVTTLIDAPLALKVQVVHFAPAAAINHDMILGALASVLLLAYPLHPMLPNIADTLSSPVIAALLWLDDWPFGLKLNTGLSAFLCGSIARVLEIWRDTATPILNYALPHVSIALAVVSPLGLSFGFALLSDLVALLTLHLRLIYFATAALSRVSMTALLGLWDLFRGRRWNVLRHRTDSHAFEVDTLFLGTLLFTVTAFLAPTVVAYGLLFALINLAVFLVQRGLALAIAGINCSVAFQIAYSVPPFPGICDGIVFDVVVPSTSSRAPDAAYPVQHALELKSTPMSLVHPPCAFVKVLLAAAMPSEHATNMRVSTVSHSGGLHIPPTTAQHVVATNPTGDEQFWSVRM
ncbi:hypothetical protein CcaverHIS002_0102410 [Cutaneotrichosporon cavernicola]|nr:hypothetical protein CcaverHIS002_0102410 [Cutaneotrichosporon cavernicola]